MNAAPWAKPQLEPARFDERQALELNRVPPLDYASLRHGIAGRTDTLRIGQCASLERGIRSTDYPQAQAGGRNEVGEGEAENGLQLDAAWLGRLA